MSDDGMYRAVLRHHLRLSAVLGAASAAPIVLLGAQVALQGFGSLGESGTWTLALGFCLLLASGAAAAVWTELAADPRLGELHTRVGLGPFILDGATVAADACDVLRVEEVRERGRRRWLLTAVGARTEVELLEDFDPTRALRLAHDLAGTVGLPLVIVEPAPPPDPAAARAPEARRARR